MTTSLLTTKLFVPPLGKNLVIRPRLLEKLNEGLLPGCRLMLISAPAGFGKTTLVSSWVSRLKTLNKRLPLSVAWLSLDKGDNDPVSFWSYIIHSIQAHEDNIGKLAIPVLQSQSAFNMDAVVSLFVNELAGIRDEFILILDDFHLIRDPVIQQSLSTFAPIFPSHCLQSV